jgi:putative transposase
MITRSCALRFAFLLITRLASWLRLSRREETWKTAEILILRHQVAVLQRRQPRRPNLNWADRALIAALLGVIPKACRHGLRLLVSPDTILRWHRDIVLRRWAARSTHAKTGRPATRRNIRALVLRLARVAMQVSSDATYRSIADPVVDQREAFVGGT